MTKTLEYHILNDMSSFTEVDDDYKKFYLIILTQPSGSSLSTEFENDDFLMKFVNQIRDHEIEVISIG